MKYIILFIPICLIFSSTLLGQSFCPPNNITTNPDAPSNTHNNNFENTFFDWRVKNEEFSTPFTDYFDPSYVTDPPYFPHHYSPYWGNFDYLAFMTGFYGGAEVVDFAPNEGWELITRNFGLLKNGSVNTGFYCPYFLMYNKYQGKFRIFFAVPSVDATGASAIEVSLKFNNTSGDDDDILTPVSGLFGHNGPTSQPLDRKTVVTSVKGIAKYNPSGWNFTDIVAAYDPCTCNGQTSVQVDFSKVTTGTITLTGGFLGTEEVLKSPSKLLSDNILLNIANNGTEAAVGVETYANIAKLVAEYNQGDGGISDAIEVLSVFSNAFAVLYPKLGAAYKAVNVAAGDLPAAKAKYKEDLGLISRTTKFATSLLKSSNEKLTLPTVIQGEIALSGDYDETILNPTASFVFDNPGTSSTSNNVETGISTHPSYPFYNEVLGRFALLKTPRIKAVTTSRQFGVTTTSTYQKTQFDEASLQYVYNPAIGVNEAKTTMLGAIIYESSTNSYANEDGYHPVIPNDHDASEYGVFLNQSYPDPTKANVSKEIFRTPWMDLECLSNYTVNFQTDSTGLNSELEPFKYNRPAVPFLQLMIFYEFDELDRNGNPNRDIQIVTYPLLVDEVDESQMNNSVSFERTISETVFRGSQVIQAMGAITITGDLSVGPTRLGQVIEVIIMAPQIIVEDGVEIGEGITLISGTPNICGSKIEKSTWDMTNYCTNGSYSGNERRILTVIEPEVETEEEHNFSMMAQPNPFGNFTTISFELEQVESVSLHIYNALGAHVESIIDGEDLPAGTYRRITRKNLPAGIYFAVLQTGNGTQTIKIVKQ